jgi:hypothetical protein
MKLVPGLNIPFDGSSDTLRKRPGSIVTSFKFALLLKNNFNAPMRTLCMHAQQQGQTPHLLQSGVGDCDFLAYGLIQCAACPIARGNI